MSKLYVLGPKNSGKTAFIRKMFGEELNTYEHLIIESDSIPEIEDAFHIFLILPSKEEMERRGFKLSNEEQEKWMKFYHQYDKELTLVEGF